MTDSGAVAQRAHAVLVLLGAKWGESPTAANVTLEKVTEKINELREAASDYGSACTGGLLVARDDETGYEVSVVIGDLP